MAAVLDRPSARNSAEVPRLGRYRVCYRIAQGGMASVYLARLDTTVGFSKWVALKVIHPNIAADEKFVTMFLDEARLAAQLDHPNLCTVFDFGEDDGTYFIAMEYLHGETLGAVARKAWGSQGALPLELGVRALADAARGLHAAHELRDVDGTLANVVHRDVSPENVFLTYSGTAKIVDFGVARSNVQEHERTATGELKGKLAYMSPEQLHERRVDRRTDVWALGVVLWEITVGRRLFRRPTDAQTVFAITRDPITRPSRLRDDYPAALEAIVMRALERDREKRFQTALEFSRALEGWLNSSGHPMGVGEVGEFMQALFADQMVWRDQYLRQGEGEHFEDLMAQWQTAPPRASVDELDADAVATSIAIAARPLTPEKPPAPMRPRELPPGPAHDDEDSNGLDASVKASSLGYDFPDDDDDGEVIPLTRRTLPPIRRHPLVTDGPAAQLSTPSQMLLDVPSTIPLPPRRKRWADYATIAALFAMGGVMAHIWYDSPEPRAPAPRARPAARAPARVEPPVSPRPGPPFAVFASRDAGAAPSAPVNTPPSHGATPHVRSVTPVDAAPRVEGYLTLTASAPSEVYAGTRHLGTTPIYALVMSPGLYALRVVRVGRDDEQLVMVTVPRGDTVTSSVQWPSEPAP